MTIVGNVHHFLHDAKQPAARDERTFDLDFRADERVEQRGQRFKRLFTERQVAEQLRQRRLAGQADRTDRVLLIENGQAFQKIVDLIEPDRQVHGRTGRHVAGMGKLRQAGG